MQACKILAAGLFAFALVAGCQQASKNGSEAGYYELEHDGRIYVFASEETYENFKKTHHMPYTFTEIGAGPDGKTVVFEADKDDPQVQGALQAAFKKRHGK